MKPYILQIEHIERASEGRYVAHIAIIDSDKHCSQGIPYRPIVVDAINEEFAKRIAEVRIEEIMMTNESELDSIYDNNNLFSIKKNYSKIYESIIIEMDELRVKQENLLTELVKNAQKSEEEGLDIEYMGIGVNLDGYQGYLVHDIRTVNKYGDNDCLELKIMSKNFNDPNEYEWLSIYDFDAGTAEKILSAIMEDV